MKQLGEMLCNTSKVFYLNKNKLYSGFDLYNILP